MIIKKFDTFLESKNDLWDIIPKSIKEISILFKENGKELYLVGGAVRDFLNNENPKDFDLCTNATPDEILNIVGNKYKTTEQGKSFGVIVIYTRDQPMGIEVATFREESYRSGDIEEFILYIRENKPDNYEERLNLLLNMSKK
jgi:tRNA nucleotidyltransferase/poly(A) polymerase